MSVDATTAAAVQGLNPSQAEVAGAIKRASTSTGASFAYLVAAAKIESNLQPNASASTSSARGLYQFIEQTWLGTVKEAGATFGYANYADAITKQSSGHYSVSDPALRQQILKLRDDPAANAAMAGVLTQSNSFRLVGAIGRRPTDGELYIAHFLGVGGASRLIAANDSKPQANAVQMFPRAAAANKPIFYDRNGDARSVSGVYTELTRRYSVAANSKAARSAVAFAGDVPAATAPQSVAVASAAPDTSAFLASFPQSSAVQPTASPSVPLATAKPQQVAALSDDGPMFRSLFQVGDRQDAISPTVRELWATGRGQVQASAQIDLSPNIKLKTPAPLDLFSDRNGTFSG